MRRRVGGRPCNARNRLRKSRPATTAARQGPQSLQTDPIGQADDPNLYAYVKDDPTNASDPSGTSAQGFVDFLNQMGMGSAEAAGLPITSTDSDRGFAYRLGQSFYFMKLEAEEGAGGGSALLTSGRGATNALRREATETGVIYRRVDANAPGGKPYIGRAKSEARYEARQREHARANPDAKYKYTELDRAKSGRDLRNAEQRQIENHGGPTNSANPGGGTENQRHEIKACPTGTRVC